MHFYVLGLSAYLNLRPVSVSASFNLIVKRSAIGHGLCLCRKAPRKAERRKKATGHVARQNKLDRFWRRLSFLKVASRGGLNDYKCPALLRIDDIPPIVNLTPHPISSFTPILRPVAVIMACITYASAISSSHIYPGYMYVDNQNDS
jgi:hypothetical protein